MPPKRAGDDSSFEKAEKQPRLVDGENVNVEHGLEKIEDLAKASDRETTSESAMQQLKSYVVEGNKALVRQLLDRQTVDLKTPEGGELLWTAYYKDQEIAAMLVRHGADLSCCRFDDNVTLLHNMLNGYRLGSTATRELFCLVLDHGADVDARDKKSKSLLNYAIRSSCQGSLELAQELLKRGARITINKEDRRMDDICLACKHKIELLPVLIQHQVADEETRHQRAITAIDGLIFENHTGAKGAAAVQMIKKILDLGVPVNVPESRRDQQKFSFLDTALWFKNKPAIKLLLDSGADPHHHHNLFGRTTLYQATAFKGYTQVSRWLIERGVSIHAPNDNGAYPIHGACINESLRNLHLLLNLGANLNATDKSGKTPFGLMKMKEKQKNREVHHLVIKHLSLTIARGEQISENDVAKISRCAWSERHFARCTEQLERMKVEKMYHDVSYFLLLSKNMYSTVQLVKNKNFLESSKRNEKRRAELFPDYFYMLLHSIEVAQKRLEVLLAEKQELHEVFRGMMPDHIVEKITYYLFFEKLKHCQHDYFMSFHAKLRNTKIIT